MVMTRREPWTEVSGSLNGNMLSLKMPLDMPFPLLHSRPEDRWPSKGANFIGKHQAYCMFYWGNSSLGTREL